MQVQPLFAESKTVVAVKGTQRCVGSLCLDHFGWGLSSVARQPADAVVAALHMPVEAVFAVRFLLATASVVVLAQGHRADAVSWPSRVLPQFAFDVPVAGAPALGSVSAVPRHPANSESGRCLQALWTKSWQVLTWMSPVPVSQAAMMRLMFVAAQWGRLPS